MKKGLLVLLFIILCTVGCSKKEAVPEKTSFEIYLKINPLISFQFKVQKDEVIVTDFKLENDKARKIFGDIDFKNKTLLEAIELYGDKVSEEKIDFTTIYVWTNWDNKEYFKSEKYNLDVTVVSDEEMKDVPQKTLSNLKLNERYYLVGDESNDDVKHGFSITFKENGELEYHLDSEYTVRSCDQCIPDECTDITVSDEMYSNEAKEYQYTIDGDFVTIGAKDGEFYHGWYKSYDKCEILFNRIKCDNYNAYHGTEATYQYTMYYELKS